MERMGDKVRAKEEMDAAGVPVVPGTGGSRERRRRGGSSATMSATRCC